MLPVALHSRIISRASAQSLGYPCRRPKLSQQRSCLAVGSPFVFDFSVYKNFESNTVAHIEKVTMLDSKSQKLLGGHTALSVVYEDAKQHLIVKTYGE